MGLSIAELMLGRKVSFREFRAGACRAEALGWGLLQAVSVVPVLSREC